MTLGSARPTLMVMTTIPETLAAFFVPQLHMLAASGFQLHVVSSPGPAFDSLVLPPTAVRHGVPIERRPHPRADIVSLWRLVRLMRRHRPHIVHAHTPKAGLLGMAAARLAGVPVRSYTVHGLPLLTRTAKWRQVLELAERMTIALATDAYAVSASVRDLLVHLKICGEGRVRVLGDGSCGGVDTNQFQPRPESTGLKAATRERYGLPASALVMSFVGRLARDKGIAVLAEAWPAVAEAIPNLHLVLAGETDASDPLPETIAAGLRRHDRVHLIGTVKHEDIPALYAATDIAVLPTFREGLSQMALESGASGVPLISCRVSGLDAVQHGETGLLVPAGQAAPLRDAIVRLATDSQFRQRLGVAARARIVSLYSQERVNRFWISEYRRLVDAALPELGHSLASIGRAAR